VYSRHNGRNVLIVALDEGNVLIVAVGSGNVYIHALSGILVL
jgi:hypothetical protein